MALNERKKTNNIMADKRREAATKNRISLVMRTDNSVRIWGKPLLYTVRLLALPNSSAILVMVCTTPIRSLDAIKSLLMRTPISQALVDGLYKRCW